RSDPADGMIRPVAAAWDELGVPYERLGADEVKRRWPVIEVSEFTVALYEPNAGVVRARRACQSVADAFEREGGELRIARAELARTASSANPRVLVDRQPFPADQYVFACGPWLAKVLPDVMANRLRLPLGHVFYYATPPGDRRWEWPNLPSYNVPGCTGWPALPPDNRGFRVRTGGRPPGDPDESDRWIPPEFHDRPRDVLRKYFPELATAVVSETRACHYESASGDSFIIDRHPAHPRVWIAGGGSAEAFKQGPVLGDYIARRVLGQDTQPELAEEFRIPEQTYEVPPGA
ncbi:MAG: NAD(P)/FAD-dependent oxidoreductase, partial [Longimicrobiales bacterium]